MSGGVKDLRPGDRLLAVDWADVSRQRLVDPLTITTQAQLDELRSLSVYRIPVEMLEPPAMSLLAPLRFVHEPPARHPGTLWEAGTLEPATARWYRECRADPMVWAAASTIRSIAETQ